MTSSHFKNVTSTLATACGNAGVTLDVYSLLALAEALIDMGFDANEPTQAVEAPVSLHEILVRMACKSHAIMESVQDNRKIVAIKELRTLATENGVIPSAGGYLATLKRAVEDSRVEATAALWSNPWTSHHDLDEPPF